LQSSTSNLFKNKISKEVHLRKNACKAKIVLKETSFVKKISTLEDGTIKNSLDVEQTFIKKNSSINNLNANHVSNGPKIQFQDITSAEDAIIKMLTSNLNKDTLIKNRISNANGRMQSYSRTLKVLFTISITFLLLNSPMAINKFWYFFKYHDTSFYEINIEPSTVQLSNQSIRVPLSNYRPIQISESGFVYFFEKNGTFFNMTFGSDELGLNESSSAFNMTYAYSKEKQDKSNTNPLEEICERISCYLYYLNFSLNFFLYSTTGSKFRNAFISMFRKETKKLDSQNKSFKHQNTLNSTQVNIHRNIV
jgi:hypothetical protein